MAKQDPITLEERVEMLEKRMRVIQWSHTGLECPCVGRNDPYFSDSRIHLGFSERLNR